MLRIKIAVGFYYKIMHSNPNISLKDVAILEPKTYVQINNKYVLNEKEKSLIEFSKRCINEFIEKCNVSAHRLEEY